MKSPNLYKPNSSAQQYQRGLGLNTQNKVISDGSIDGIKDFKSAYRMLSNKLIENSMTGKESEKTNMLITNKSLK